MTSQIQKIAAQNGISYIEFVGEMRKRSCSEATAAKIWSGCYENFQNFSDNDINLSNLRKAADVLKINTALLLTR